MVRNLKFFKVIFLLSIFSTLGLSAQELKVEFVTPSIVRVQYTQEPSLKSEANATGVVLRSVPSQSFVKTKNKGGKTVMQSESLIVEIGEGSKAITFIDRKTKKVLLRETAAMPRKAEKVFTEKIIYDEKSARTVQTADGQKVEKDIIRRDTLGYTWQYAMSFDWQNDEGLYGLGSHIEDFMNLRGKTQYLTQHNLKAMVPVLNSTKGYGLLFDAGCAMKMEDKVITYDAARQIDYYFMKGEKLDDVVAQYRYLTGDCPMMPRYLFGYTQSKERYFNQQEVIDIVKEYRRRQVPLDMVVQDWNYWPEGWGYMHMDPKHYPDPKAMADSVHAYNAKLMISIWPNPQYCPQAEDFKSKGFMLEHSVYDAFSPAARDYYWSYADREFFSKGFDAWWCDCSEPLDGDWKNLPNGYSHNNHLERWQSTKQILTEALGAERSSLYSLYHAQGIYEHQRAATDAKRVVNLTRSSYAGQQRYSTITWNGDTYASWESFRKQIPGGLNFMATGCPYWSVDVGSFFTNGDRWSRWFYVGEFPKGCNDPAYREYYTRMFQWATFLPMLRSHGSDTPREIWRFGEPGTPFYDAILSMIHLRYKMLPYSYSLAGRVTHDNYTMSRLLAFDFADDANVLDIKDEFMYGPSFLVCPVTTPGVLDGSSKPSRSVSRSVYLPKGTKWYDYWNNKLLDGGQTIQANASIKTLPLYVREGSIIPMGPVVQYSGEKTSEPTYLYVYPGTDATFTLYDDAGDGYSCEKGEYTTVKLMWNDKSRTFTIGDRQGSFEGMKKVQNYVVQLPDGKTKILEYSGKKIVVKF